MDIDKVWKFADPEEIASLQEQNENLKSVIKEMRTQMEILGQELPPSDKKSDPSTAGGMSLKQKRTATYRTVV